MMKTKLISLFVLMLALVLCVTACDIANPGGSETTANPGAADTTAAPDETTASPEESEPDGTTAGADVTTAPAETDDPKVAEGKAIRAALVKAITAHGGKISLPTKALASVAGDYMIGTVKESEDYDDPVKRIWRKGDVLCTEYVSGAVDYVVVRDGYEVSIYNYGEGCEVGYVFEAENGMGSVLTDIGLDLSFLGSSSGTGMDSVLGMELPDFTEEMIDFSADLKTFTFSKEITDSFLKGIYIGFKMPAEDLDAAVAASEASIVYHADTDRLVFLAKGNAPEIGDFEVELAYCGLVNGPFSVEMKMELQMNVSDMPASVVLSLAMTDIATSGDDFVSGNMAVDVLMLASAEMQGMKVDVEANMNATYTLDFSDPESAVIGISIKESTKTSVLGQVIENSSETNVKCNLKKNGSITISTVSDGEVFEAEYSGLLFGADATYPALPEGFDKMIRDAIEEYKAELSE